MIDKFNVPQNHIHPVGKGNVFVITAGLQQEIQTIIRYIIQIYSDDNTKLIQGRNIYYSTMV